MLGTTYKGVDNLSDLPAPDESGYVTQYVFENINFHDAPQYVFAGHRFKNCCFFGCDIPREMEDGIGRSCLEFPKLDRKYNVFLSKLYTGETLYEGYNPSVPGSESTCFDARVYEDYIAHGKQCYDIRETLGRSLHDRAIEDTMGVLLRRLAPTQIVAIMGGHALKRTDPAFRKIVEIAKTLTERGKFLASGGGPGAMEATHIGAWMAGRSAKELDDAIDMLSAAPTFRDEGWLRTAFEVRAKFPQNRFRSLGIPTWFYGHEPSTPFATDIAKFFKNSAREDILLTIAKGGIIYAAGSAGTMQEVFQDAAQNHYRSVDFASPMVFLGKEFYTKDIPVYPLLEDLIARGKYNEFPLFLSDSEDEIVKFLMDFRPESQ